MIPAKADPAVQANYLKQTMEPRLNEAKEGKRAVFGSGIKYMIGHIQGCSER